MPASPTPRSRRRGQRRRGGQGAMLTPPARLWLLTETALTHGVTSESPEEVDLPEVGPVHVREIELGVGTLPEQESGQTLFAAGTDDEVGIRLALGVEMLRDVVDVEHLGELLDGATALRVLVQQRPDRVRDLSSTAVADGDIDPCPLGPAGRTFLGRLQRERERARQHVERADHAQT